MSEPVRVIPFERVRMRDLPQVGGKNASLGEMIGELSAAGIRVPGGFATTAHAFREFLQQDGLAARIERELSSLDVADVGALGRTGNAIRGWIADAPLPQALAADIERSYATLVANGSDTASFAVRSSATAEDLPDASFAGQQDTLLNISGLHNLLHAVSEVFASVYNDRAIAYRAHHGFAHQDVALSVGVQRMVRSDEGAAGVMFTLDTESGFEDVVLITSAYGLGESVVQGSVNPDEFYVYKPNLAAGRLAVLRRSLGSKATRMVFGASAAAGKSTRVVDVPEDMRRRFSLTDAQVEELARHAVAIERHYGRPMDIEWALDGHDGGIYILQARPETVKSREDANALRRYRLKSHAEPLASGRAIGQKIGQGPVRLVRSSSEMDRVEAGDVLVTELTDPDWEPVMKRASAIVTNRGGRTCHAAIIARELGIPAVVGCGDATRTLKDGAPVTVSCAEGDTGHVYAGLLDIETVEVALDRMPACPTKIMMNVGNPELAFEFCQLPNEGVGLARLEFIINRNVGIHPKALLEFDRQPTDVRRQIEQRIGGYASPTEFYVSKIVEGVATIAAAFAPKPVIVRLSDFKSNEYSNLLGGDRYEPHEENPMLGFRGASRYIAPDFAQAFEMECLALKRVREDMGLTNVEIMVPFVRTVKQAERVVGLLDKFGLKRGVNGLRLIMMCEVPSNAILAEQFLEHFDGFSIGSNDLTQLTLGLDRDSGMELLAIDFDERDEAVKFLLKRAIETCRRLNKYVGICGQGPSDHPDFAQWLADEGIASISLNPDTIIETWQALAKSAK
jgi:pyruvate, water dikinase